MGGCLASEWVGRLSQRPRSLTAVKDCGYGRQLCFSVERFLVFFYSWVFFSFFL